MAKDLLFRRVTGHTELVLVTARCCAAHVARLAPAAPGRNRATRGFR
jgi:hypothetical protein